MTAARPGPFRQLSSATCAVLDRLDPSGAWAVRNAVHRLALDLHADQVRRLTDLMGELDEALARVVHD